MSSVWLLLGLTSLLTVLNSVAVIGLIRQIGVLHLRIEPIPGLEGFGGPEPGTRVSFDKPPVELPGISADAQRFILGFFSPTCSVCGPLVSALRSVAGSLNDDEEVILVTDAEPSRASEYLRGKRASLPLIAEPDSFRHNNVSSAPFLVVTDREGVVEASAVVNTLEQIEWVVDQARMGAGLTKDASRENGDAPPGIKAHLRTGERRT